MTGVLTSRAIAHAYHYAPLHYLPFIARCGALLSKRRLQAAGHNISHFRSTSRRQDEERGFADYVHLMLTQFPPILLSKISRGFPHFEIQITSASLEQRVFHLCRYNIAKSRYLKRPGATAPVECAANGWYHGNKQLPTAEGPEECAALLEASAGNSVIEILVPSMLRLDRDTTLLFFSSEERALAQEVLRDANITWKLELTETTSYAAKRERFRSVREFIRRASADSAWFGDGLEFDRL
jgi:hypothetical protein